MSTNFWDSAPPEVRAAEVERIAADAVFCWLTTKMPDSPMGQWDMLCALDTNLFELSIVLGME